MNIIYSIKSSYLDRTLSPFHFLSNSMQFHWKTKKLWWFNIQNLVCRILSLYFVQILFHNISATVRRRVFKFWLIICFAIRDTICQTQKTWWPSWSYFMCIGVNLTWIYLQMCTWNIWLTKSKLLEPLYETFSLTSSAFTNYVEENLFKNFKKWWKTWTGFIFQTVLINLYHIYWPLFQ